MANNVYLWAAPSGNRDVHRLGIVTHQLPLAVRLAIGHELQLQQKLCVRKLLLLLKLRKVLPEQFLTTLLLLIISVKILLLRNTQSYGSSASIAVSCHRSSFCSCRRFALLRSQVVKAAVDLILQQIWTNLDPWANIIDVAR